jgi:hypothetical protein
MLLLFPGVLCRLLEASSCWSVFFLFFFIVDHYCLSFYCRPLLLISIVYFCYCRPLLLISIVYFCYCRPLLYILLLLTITVYPFYFLLFHRKDLFIFYIHFSWSGCCCFCRFWLHLAIQTDQKLFNSYSNLWMGK